MKALSIKQPWVYAITDLGKKIENRTWFAPSTIINKTIAIHASKKPDRSGFSAIFDICGTQIEEDLVYGAIVATARVIDVTQFSSDPWFFGPVGWVLSDVQKLLKPIPCRGQLGLWTVKPDVMTQVLSGTG